MPNPNIRASRLALAALLAALTVILLLFAAAVDDVAFQPRQPSEFSGATTVGGRSDGLMGMQGFQIFLRYMFIAGGATLILFLLFGRRTRKIYLALLLFALVALFISEVVSSCNREAEPTSSTLIEAVPEDTPDRAHIEPAPEPEYAVTSSQYVILAVILSAMILIVSGLLIIRWMRRRPEPEAETFDEIYDSLSDAARRIRAGEDPYTVVLYCYQEMIRVLSIKGRIDATFLTPREFENSLRVAGLSDSHIRELTEIFEVVRYGARIDEDFPERALACLDAIQEANLIE